MSDTQRMAELKRVYGEKIAEFNAALDGDAIKIDGQNVEVKNFDGLQELKSQCEEIKSLIIMEQFGIDEKAWAEAPAEVSAAMAGAAGFAGLQQQAPAPQFKTLGEMFVKSDVFTDFQKTGRYTMPEPFELSGDAGHDVTSQGTYGQKDVYGSLLTGSVNPRGFGSVQFDPAVPRPQRPTRVRDLFPVATTNSNLIDYFRVLGFTTNGDQGNAAPVRDRTAADGTSAPVGDDTDVFGLKPKSQLAFQSAQAPVRTIAHWEAAHRNVLRDEPQLQSTINNELLYGLSLEEDSQILNGDGTNENLLGILQTPGIQGYTQAQVAAGPPIVYEPKSDALRRSQTKAILANYPPTGYVLHPNDWEDVELQKDTQGRYMLVSNVSVGAEARVWRLPVVETPAMPEGTFLTGAFGIGAQLYDREVANVRIAEQHADFFVRNAVAILVEERLALAVKRPESFVKGTFLS